jgi:hypothetical protein
MHPQYRYIKRGQKDWYFFCMTPNVCMPQYIKRVLTTGISLYDPKLTHVTYIKRGPKDWYQSL